MSLDIIRNASLASLNTMAVPASADFFVNVICVEEFISAIEFANKEKLDVFVLGEGSNTLFTQDYAGLVIHNNLLGIEILDQDDSSVLVKVAAGENWHTFVDYTVEHGWSGLENLALIPGLVGAAPIQNIGAYGVEAKDCIVNLQFLDFKTLELIELGASQCQFAYRDSIFKRSLTGAGAITSVTFRLLKQATLNLSYPELARKLAAQSSPTAKQVFDAVVEIRSAKLPCPSEIPNLGSFFKNPIVSAAVYRQLKNECPQLVAYPHHNDFKLAAAWLIDSAGWKLKVIKDVRVHAQQALVIINPLKVSGAHVLNFAEAIRDDIRCKYGIELEIEPNIV